VNESSSCPVFLDESSFREAKLVLMARDLIRLIGNAGTGGIFSILRGSPPNFLCVGVMVMKLHVLEC